MLKYPVDWRVRVVEGKIVGFGSRSIGEDI